jgi:hypothetical protein
VGYAERVTANGSSNGHFRNGSSVTVADIEPDTPTQDRFAEPEFISELSQSCRQFVHTSLGIVLDGSPETLPLLDHYLASARQEIRSRPEALPLLAQAIGAYFGGVIAAQIDGFWRVRGADYFHWLVCARPVFLAINPVGAAYDALTGSQDHDGPSSELYLAREDQAVVLPRLAALPEMSEEDYYRLSTRFETLEIAVAALREAMYEGGQGDVSFEPADYDEM